MRILVVLLALALALPVSATELTAPEVPRSGANLMPEDTASFAEGLVQILRKAVGTVRPDLQEALNVCVNVLAMTLLVSITQQFPGTSSGCADLVGTVTISATLLGSTNVLLRLGTDTVCEISEYGKLLLPVMTSAMAAQGGVTTSAALYAGTSLFSSILSSMISSLLRPMVYLFLALSAANGAVGEGILKRYAGFVKSASVWVLKVMLYIFTGYMGITGVVSGTTDAAALKAAKLTISGVVPVVGGILSDASEAVLVSAGVIKNAAGIYGIFAILAVFLRPFLRIGSHYLMLKITHGLCEIFGSKRMAGLVGDFATAMGLVLGMTGSVCLLLLISTVCFLKGVS